MKTSRRVPFPFALLAALALFAAACGGAGPATPAAATGPAGQSLAGADPCGVPAKTKCPTEATALTGAGATFPAPIYTKWIDEYNKLTGVEINYQAIGSGGGIKAFTDKTADFGASDVPLTDDQIAAISSGFYTIPTVLGAVVPTYNIPSVTTSLKLTPDALAGIYLEQIKKWNDPKIASENPGVALPDLAITTVHRSDGSGTTGVFTDYLSKVSPDWKTKVGSATSVNWPGGVGASGNAGVAGAVKQTPGSIGYVELIYAIQNKLGYGIVKNAAGKYVEASLDSTTKAADGVTLPDLGSLKGQQAKISITNSPNADAWPISTYTWILIPKDFSDAKKATAVVRYLWYSTHEGQGFAKNLGYAPLPTTAQKIAEELLRSVTAGGAKVIR
jgi:phosphate transport system substrate-binding protein